MDRYERLATAFVSLADTLVADYDVIELAQQLIDSTMLLLPIAAAGILLGDANGDLHVFASSSEESRLLELLEVEADVGRASRRTAPRGRCSSRTSPPIRHGGRPSPIAPRCTTSDR